MTTLLPRHWCDEASPLQVNALGFRLTASVVTLVPVVLDHDLREALRRGAPARVCGARRRTSPRARAGRSEPSRGTSWPGAAEDTPRAARDCVIGLAATDMRMLERWCSPWDLSLWILRRELGVRESSPMPAAFHPLFEFREDSAESSFDILAMRHVQVLQNPINASLDIRRD